VNVVVNTLPVIDRNDRLQCRRMPHGHLDGVDPPQEIPNIPTLPFDQG